MQLLKRSFQLSVFGREVAGGQCSVVSEHPQLPHASTSLPLRASASPCEHLSHSSTSSRGSALLIVLGMLSFLLISSVAFAVYMRVERMATSNYRHSVMARQLIQLAFADARNTVTEIVDNNKSTFWPIFYKATPEARILMSLPKWRDSDGNMRDTDYPDAYTTGATASSTEGTGLSFTPGAGPSLLSDEVIKHVPPALVKDVMNARWQAQWRPIKQPQLVESDSGGSASVNPVVGRYAWMAVNVSDMLDINVSGTNTLTGGKRNFGSLGGADLKLDGDVGILNSASTYKTAANVGDLKARFLSGADLASLADDTVLFAKGVLDWKSAVGLRTDGGDPAPFTVYSRFPVMPPPALPITLTIQDWTNNMAIPMDQLNSTMTSVAKSRLTTALGASGLQSSLSGNDFADMITDYVAPNSGTLYSGNTKGMLMPPMKPAPMISQIAFNFEALQGALFDPGNKIPRPVNSTAPLFLPVRADNQEGLAASAQIKIQVANLFDEEWTGTSTVDVQGGWAVFWNDGSPQKSAGTAFIGAKNGNLGTLEKGTFSTVALQYGFPNISPIKIATPVEGMPIMVDLFFRFFIKDLDELPLSDVGIVQVCDPSSSSLDVNSVGFCGEKYFHTRIGFRLKKQLNEDGTIASWWAEPDSTVAGVWNPAGGRWDCIDPRYNWFSPASVITANNPVLSQQVLSYFNVSGYDKTRSSIHWFFRQNGGSSGTEPSELMKAVWDFARTNPDKGLDIVNPSGGYSESGKQRYYAFSHSGLGRMYSPLEFGFFPRQLVAPVADSGAWLNKGVDNLPFYRSIRVYPYANPTTTATAVDDKFLRYFAESIGTRKGLLYGGSPGTAGDYLRDMQFNGLPPAVSELGKTELAAAGYPELDSARLKLTDWLGSLADNKFKDIAANGTDPGIRELEYSDIPVASIPPTVNGATPDIFRAIPEIAKLPEVKRKLLAAVAQCGASRRQQLFLYILRADAYKPIVGDSLSGGSSSASCRAVALVWRDPFVKGAETMTGTATGLYRKEWFYGTTAGSAPGGSNPGSTIAEHAERLIYFQILD